MRIIGKINIDFSRNKKLDFSSHVSRSFSQFHSLRFNHGNSWMKRECEHCEHIEFVKRIEMNGQKKCGWVTREKNIKKQQWIPSRIGCWLCVRMHFIYFCCLLASRVCMLYSHRSRFSTLRYVFFFFHFSISSSLSSTRDAFIEIFEILLRGSKNDGKTVGNNAAIRIQRKKNESHFRYHIRLLR